MNAMNVMWMRWDSNLGPLDLKSYMLTKALWSLAGVEEDMEQMNSWAIHPSPAEAGYTLPLQTV